MIELSIDYHCGIPVYKQMVDALSAAIFSGDLIKGEQLPPIRKLSEQLAVNPNTTAKVYRELELKGLIESITGSGCFVLAVTRPELDKAQKEERMSKLFNKLLLEAKNLNIVESEFLKYLRKRVSE